MKRAVLWLALIAATVLVTLLAFLPAAWLAQAVESQTGGRLTLGDPQGSLWRGSAFIGAAPGAQGGVTPLLPGRFAWRLSPMVLLGQLDLRLENDEALLQPLSLTGDWSQWQLSADSLMLPAAGLAGLGAPLNTIAPSGNMRLVWSALALARVAGGISVDGRTTLEMSDMASRLSNVNPLGSYALAMDWHGQQAQLTLTTLRGALLLSGKGGLEHGRLQFSGQAEAAKGYEDTLGNLLNLLGQRRMIGDKNIIALEFK